ncbi:MAG: 4-hydroxy-3-methylbut-2-en-1-yl diphosphate synthase [Mariprofundus sp.]|nr:4-hydroxy-3-methylbut-2-en-1-yl diphosphate synthase [Mariprofundus sp.]
MHKNRLRIMAMICLAGLLTGCQSGAHGPNGILADSNSMLDLFEQGSEAIGIMNTLTLIQHDYDSGRIMRARARVLAMDKSHRDYVESHRFLKQKIEPARRRVFLHYLRAAGEHEKQGRWAAAMWAYDQARTVTIKPEKMVEKREQMKLNMRQVRFDQMLKQRRKEDSVLLADASAYENPKGVAPSDEVFARMREHYNDLLDERADHAFREARRFLSKNLPEIAYVEIESYVRLQPGSAQATKIVVEIRKSMPKGLIIPSLKQAGVKKLAAGKRLRMPQKMSEKQVLESIKSGDFIQARQFAQVYRRNGGQNAEKLLTQIQTQLDKESAKLFAQGSKAFAQEKLDKAIDYWGDAVAMKPEKSEYQESLRRAKQLKERLNLLRDQKVENGSVSMHSKKPNSPISEEE